jgi:putative flippase GtrA
MNFLLSLWTLFRERADLVPVQFVRFCMVGVLNTLTTFFTYIALTRTQEFFYVHYVGAEALAYFAGTIVSFTLNRRWTFRQDASVSVFEIVRFYSALLSGLAVNVMIFYLLVEWGGLYDIVAVGVSLLFTIAWNFLFMKFWVFKAQSTR